MADPLKGQVPVGFVVLKAGVDRDPSTVAAELVALVRNEIGPVAFFKDARVVNALPKTRSGKILRATISKMADGEQWRMPGTIEDASVLDEFKKTLSNMGRKPTDAAQT
jgi:propionyl-CoA synthetase